jgi:hypothetical protein
MANEINIQAQLTVSLGGATINGAASKSITIAGTGLQATVQNIGTTTEALSFTDMDDIGYLYLKNQDATNFIMVGLVSPVSAGNAFLTLLPGEFALVPTRQETIYAIADTAACDLQVVACEK